MEGEDKMAFNADEDLLIHPDFWFDHITRRNEPEQSGWIEDPLDEILKKYNEMWSNGSNEGLIQDRISMGWSIPEIRNELHDPDWTPTEKHIELMRLAKEAEAARRKRLETEDQFLEPEGHGSASCGDRFSPDDARDRTHRSVRRKIQKRKETALVVSKDSLICIDGSNVIGLDSELRTKILQAIIAVLEKAGYQFRVFVDKTIFSWLKNKKHDEAGAEFLACGEKRGFVIVAPNKVEADGQVLQFVEFEKGSHIISNDRYRDYVEMHPWLTDETARNRLHGINLVSPGNGTVRVLIAGFNLDITVS